MTEQEVSKQDSNEVAPKAEQPKQYVVSEQALNQLLSGISNLRWSDANPLIDFIRKNFTPLPTA